MFTESTIISAIIAAVTSLVIAGFSGVFVLYKTRKEIDLFQKKIISQKQTERFIRESNTYRNQYKKYEKKLRELIHYAEQDGEKTDGTKITQHILDFYGISKEFYYDNKTLLTSTDIEANFVQVQALIDSKTLNDKSNPNRLRNLQTVNKTSRVIFSLLYEKIT